MPRPDTDDGFRHFLAVPARRTVNGRRFFARTFVVACATYGTAAHAERWTIAPNIETRATYTDNVAFEDRTDRQADTILELIPSVVLRGEGKRFRVQGSLLVDALTYVEGKRDNRLLPTVDLTANLEAIERFFFLEAGVITRQGAEDVFGARPDGGADFNTVTTTQYRAIPTFEGKLGSNVQYRLRSENSWTQISGAESELDGQYLGEHSFRIDRQPSPLGWGIEAARSDTRFESATPDSVVIDSGRLFLRYALTPTFIFGVRGGYESTNLITTNDEQIIYGADLSWRPTERTDLSALWEERFFGGSWRFRFNHRMPRLSWSVTFSRDVASFPQAFLTLPPTNNVAALLDAAFTTRFPDAAERNRVVQDLISRQGLPSSLESQTSLFTQQVTILTSANVQIAYVGIRNSIIVNAFSSRNAELPDSIFTATTSATSVKQEGVSLTLSHQVTPLTSVNLTGGYTRTRGFGVNEGADTIQRLLRLQMTRQLTPKSTVFIGARTQEFDLTGDTQPTRENAVFAGLGHRF